MQQLQDDWDEAQARTPVGERLGQFRAYLKGKGPEKSGS